MAIKGLRTEEVPSDLPSSPTSAITTNQPPTHPIIKPIFVMSVVSRLQPMTVFFPPLLCLSVDHRTHQFWVVHFRRFTDHRGPRQPALRCLLLQLRRYVCLLSLCLHPFPIHAAVLIVRRLQLRVQARRVQVLNASSKRPYPSCKSTRRVVVEKAYGMSYLSCCISILHRRRIDVLPFGCLCAKFSEISRRSAIDTGKCREIRLEKNKSAVEMPTSMRPRW